MLKNLFKTLFLHSPKRTFFILGSLVVMLSLPITILLSQKQQDLRQRADIGSDPTITLSCSNPNSWPSTLAGCQGCLACGGTFIWCKDMAAVPGGTRYSQCMYSASQCQQYQGTPQTTCSDYTPVATPTSIPPSGCGTIYSACSNGGICPICGNTGLPSGGACTPCSLGCTNSAMDATCNNGSISGTVFIDTNGDGIFQNRCPENSSTPCIIEFVYTGGAKIASNPDPSSRFGPNPVITDGSGRYGFGYDNPGTYIVTLTLPDGYINTSPLSKTVIISSSNLYSAANFGIKVAPTATPTAPPVGTTIACPTGTTTTQELKSKGDANCNGRIDLGDYNLWRDEFIALLAGDTVRTKYSDFNTPANDVGLSDYNIWRDNFILTLGL